MTTTNYIPDEVIAAEILPRLPVKSLLKFRCVAKSWCYLISSGKDFIKSHLENSKKKKSLIASFRCKTQTGSYSCRLLMQSPLESLFRETSCLAVLGLIDHDFSHLCKYELNLVGTCNGLCCLRVENSQFILWNPATKKYHKLPEVPGFDYATAGFGYDEANNGYKILAIYEYFVHNESVKLFKVYSSSTNSWKQVEPNFPSKNFTISDYGKFLNGKIHWRAFNISYRTYHIVSFELKSEVFGWLEQPKIEEPFNYRALGVLDGCLSVSYILKKGDTQVWVMKEYGIKESWHLQENFSDPIGGGAAAVRIPIRREPIHISQGSEILIAYDYGFLIYNLKTKKCRYLELPGSHDLLAYAFVESLVSPVPVGESEMPQSQG